MELDCATHIDYYRQRLIVYVVKTAEAKNLFEILSQTIPSEIEKIALDFEGKEQINILSIGSAEGDTDFEMLKIIHAYVLKCLENKNKEKHPIKILNRAIEPDATALDLYKAAVNKLPKELRNVNILFDTGRPRTVEEYIAEKNDSEVGVLFDIIHLLHCVYFIPELRKVLEHLYEKQLCRKGIILVVFQHRNSLMCTLQEKGHGLFNVPYDRTTEIIEIAKKNNWKYTKYIQENYFDVSEVFDENSVEGNLLLDFLVFQRDFRSQGKREDVDDALKIIKENSVYKEGKYFAKGAQSIIFINKQ